MEKQPVSLEAVIEKIKPPLEQAANNKHIALSFFVEASLPFDGDKEMISSVLRNLISNAIKFTPTNGKVEVEITKKEEQVCIAVTDSGIGMSESMISKLFQVGQKINRKGTAGESSSGLGLVITHEFVKLHDGKMMVTSQEGKGTRFEVVI
jgi:signal transduction histidine kinase